MKKYTLFSTALLAALTGHAQISIDSGDFAAPGDHIVQYTDTSHITDPGNAGADLIWDFSLAEKQQQVEIDVVTVGTTGMANHFPEATLAMTEDGGQSYGFFSGDASTFQSLGFAAITPGVDPMPYEPALVEYIFPLQYQSDFGSSYASTVSIDASDMGMYRIIIRHHGNIHKIVDGWGTLITPTGTYQALRVKVTEDALDSTFLQMTEDSEPQFMDQSTSTTITYVWLAKNGKLPVAEFDNGYLRFLEGTGNASLDEQASASSPVAYPNPTEAGQGFRFSGLDNATYTLYLYDLNGKCIYGTKATGSGLRVETEGLQAGMYHYVLSTGQQERPYTGSVLVK